MENQSEPKVKPWLQIFLLPVVVGMVGSIATFFITDAQIRSSERIVAAERASAERQTRAEQRLKMLELFSDKMTSEKVRERQLAVRLLGVIDVDLASQLAGVIAGDESESLQVREEARQFAEKIKQGYAFAVVASKRELDKALDIARRIKTFNIPYEAEVYLAENDYYAVTLGGYLEREEAEKRIQQAREKGVASDAYVWQSRNWGENLYK